MTTANLARTGLCHSLHYPLPPERIVPLEHIFALQVNNGPLTAELKDRENNISVYYL